MLWTQNLLEVSHLALEHLGTTRRKDELEEMGHKKLLWATSITLPLKEAGAQMTGVKWMNGLQTIQAA